MSQDQNVSFNSSQIEHVHISSSGKADSDSAQPRPVLQLELTPNETRRSIVLKNVGAAPAIDIDYKFAADGHDPQIGEAHLLNPGQTIALTGSFYSSESSIHRLLGYMHISGHYRDGDSNDYEIRESTGAPRSLAMLDQGVLVTYRVLPRDESEMSQAQLSEGLWSSAFYFDESHSVTVFPQGVLRGSEQRTDTGIEVHFGDASADCLGTLRVERTGAIVLNSMYRGVPGTGALRTDLLVAEMIAFLLFSNRLLSHSDRNSADVIVDVDRVQGVSLEDYYRNDIGQAVIEYTSDQSRSRGSRPIDLPLNNEFFLQVCKLVLEECLSAFKGRNRLNEVVRNHDLQVYRWSISLDAIAQVASRVATHLGYR